MHALPAGVTQGRMTTYLDFEKPIADLEGKIEELRRMSAQGEAISLEDEVSKLEHKAGLLLRDIYAKLTPWQKTQVARHPERPHFLDYVHALFQDFTALGGDRVFADDKAILGGLASFRGRSVMVIGHEKGNDTKSRLRHNFGMAMPDGYRKAVRLMTMAERFNMPVVTLVDTSGAYPGLSAEERGQGEAIAAWQRLGATFGSDANAETTPTHTVYKLDIPDVNDAKLAESFKLLSGMIRSPVLNDVNVDAERPIVLAEKRERGGAGQA